MLLSVIVKSDLHAGLQAGGWTRRASARKSFYAHRGVEPQGSAGVSRDLMHMPVLTGYCNPWALFSISNCSVFIEFIALLHRLNKPPWVVFPAWGQLALLDIAKQLWGANAVWRKGSGPSWQRWPGCGAACGQEGLFGRAACKTERLTWRAVGPLCLPNHLFPQEFPSPVFFGLLKFNLLGRKCQVKDISVLRQSVLGSLFACSCRDKLDEMTWL